MIPAGRLLYIDSSLFVRSLLPDEPGHAAAREVLTAAAGLAVTWCMAQAEVSGALRAAAADGRVPDDMRGILFDSVFASHDAPLLLPGAPGATTILATAVAGRQSVRALDAIHIATALTEARTAAMGVPAIFTTLDNRQAEAARAEGLEVVVPA